MKLKVLVFTLASSLTWNTLTAQTNKDSAHILIKQAQVLQLRASKVHALAVKIKGIDALKSVILDDSAIVLNLEAIYLIMKASAKLNQPQ